MSNIIDMQVVKRNGQREDVSFDKVTARIRGAAEGLTVNSTMIAQKVLASIIDGIKTSELDELTCTTAISYITEHPDYGILASRIAVSNHQKSTPDTFAQVVERLAAVRNKRGDLQPAVSDKLVYLMKDKGAEIESHIDYNRDYLFDYFGFKTLEKSYLLRDENRAVVERPQHMWMRTALELWSNDLVKAFDTYNVMSQKLYTHATPTLFNSCTPKAQLSSCFLLAMKDDSISGIYETLKDCATISKHSGGIGLHIHNIRAKGSIIHGTNGVSNGIVPMLRVFNNTACYVDQCFTPETLLFTENGVKQIADVGVSDKVLTATGSYEEVNIPVRHDYSGPILEIAIKNAISPIKVTPEHQILILPGQQKGLNFATIQNRLAKNLATPMYVDARDLTETDFVVFPIPSYEKDISSLSVDDCRFYGIMLGDGHISEATAYVSLHKDNKQSVADFVTDYLANRGVRSHDVVEENTRRIRWSPNSAGFKFTRTDLYDANKEKTIPASFLHLPKEKTVQIIRGLLETDGSIGSKEVTLEMSSESVIESVRYMFLRLGALASGYDRDRVGNVSSYKNITTRKTTKVLRIPRIPEVMTYFPDAPKSEYFTYFQHGNQLFSRIESITETTYEGPVHDFEIKPSHNYTIAHGGVVHNGGGKRNGSFAIYLEPWHADIEDFVRMKTNTGSEDEKARDLFYALWIPDLFMKRVVANGDWTLFCPAEAPGLADCHSEEFEKLYEKYEAEGRGRKTVKAQKLWFEILDSQIETGTPYLVYKDAANRKSNQQNLGTIKSSNLCSEIIEYSAPDETAVCNLASMALPAFIRNGAFDFTEFRRVVRMAVENLNRVIDVNFYPTPETERSNLRHRPVGLGVQGLADVFALLKMSWESPEAFELNKQIFGHMYYAALEQSVELAKDEGSYKTFKGSPASKGQLQFDLWGTAPIQHPDLDWTALKASITTFGLRNSLLVAPMPTASTSQILGYNECIEPFTSNIYTRRTLAGEFILVNKYLIHDLLNRGLWSADMKNKIIANNGSIQGIAEIPADLQVIYKTVWDMKQKTLIDMAADRGAYICQSQSLNLFVPDPDYRKLTSMHVYAWQRGLKTGIYYLRTKSAVKAQQFTVEPIQTPTATKVKEQEECTMCSA
jgi:ribonucleoside-diphosphate reductase alpha chain